MARALLVPVKAFKDAKHRLSPVLSGSERADLVRALAEHVLRQRGPMPAFVACDDDDVARWAVERDASVLWTAALGLSGAVRAAVSHLGRRGIDLVVVAHGDLPFVEGLDEFGTSGAITLAPDRREDGTNVMAVPSASSFAFSYGPGSFARHVAEAARLELPCHVVRDWRLATDVDHPADLTLLESPQGTASWSEATARAENDTMKGDGQ